MELAFEEAAAIQAGRKAVVSILLIVELAFEEMVLRHAILVICGFQSFLSWNWLLKGITSLAPAVKVSVSIILIVELAFEDLPRLEEKETRPRFNPSYRGIGF